MCVATGSRHTEASSQSCRIKGKSRCCCLLLQFYGEGDLGREQPLPLVIYSVSPSPEEPWELGHCRHSSPLSANPGARSRSVRSEARSLMQILFHSGFQLLLGVAQNHSVNGAVTEVTDFLPCAICKSQYTLVCATPEPRKPLAEGKASPAASHRQTCEPGEFYRQAVDVMVARPAEPDSPATPLHGQTRLS